MLSYLAAALPESTSAAARLLALQCALRMTTQMQVRLPKGVMRSLRLDTAEGTWNELEHARWLRTAPQSAANEISAELLDATLLGQAPARPDRRQAADWALRAGSSPAARVSGPLLRLASVYLAAHTNPDSGTGLGESDQMGRACGLQPLQLPSALDQLMTTGLLEAWRVCPASGDLQWTVVSGTGIRGGDRRWEAVGEKPAWAGWL